MRERGGARTTLVSDADIRKAFDASVFKHMSAGSREALLASAHQITLARKEYLFRNGEPGRVVLILRGLLRAARVDANGNELTVLWAQTPESIGLTSVVQAPAIASIQAVTDANLLELSMPTVRGLAQTDTSVALCVASLATTRLRQAIDLLVEYAYGDLRERVQLRLLEAACRMPPATPLIAPINQEDLAKATGASRSSVARVLRELREEGHIRSMYGGILIVRPEALAPRQQKVA